MYPPHAIVGRDWPHTLGEFLWLGHHKVIEDRNDGALGVEGTRYLLVYPVFLINITLAPVHRARRAHQDKVFRGADALQKIVVKLASLQSYHV